MTAPPCGPVLGITVGDGLGLAWPEEITGTVALAPSRISTWRPAPTR